MKEIPRDIERLYSIGEVAKIVGIHDQTIRMYERKGLISPERTESNIRVFSTEDIDRITLIITLTQELGMNFSGVKVVFELAKQLEMSMEDLLDFVSDHTREFLT